MHLKRLEVFGFKSFADKTTLEFGPGIAAIVGPNGCGKSNVFDAVRWVLGEQSAKDLRGSSMEDVIFNGTDKRSPLGFSEVALTFSNEDRVLPHDTDEVTVMRRLYRSGESEYLINKNNCRLRDIVEMFMGTGVGAEAYSLVAQGRVDMVVSAKPDDRRQIFDEAAGITKYKSKKKEALSKLKETEDNLVRINDIVVEVKRQIATIERQAKKAQKYKEDFTQLTQFEIVMAQYTMHESNQQLSLIREQIVALQEQEAQAMNELTSFGDRLVAEQDAISQLDEQINELKSLQYRLDSDVSKNEQQIAFNEEKLSDIEVMTLRLEEDKKLAMERCAQQGIKIDELKNTLSHCDGDIDAAQTKALTIKEQLQVLVHSIEEAQATIKMLNEEINTFNSQEVRLKNALTDNFKRVTELVARQRRLEQENAKVTDEKYQVGERFRAICAAIAETQAGLDGLWNILNQQRSQLEVLNLSSHHQQEIIDRLEREHVFLISQKEFIEKMQVQYQDIPDPIVEGRLIVAVKPLDHQSGIIGKIKAVNTLEATENQSAMYEIVFETKYVDLDLGHMDQRLISLDEELRKAQELKLGISRDLTVLNGTIDGTLKQIQDQEKKLSVFEAQKNDVELETGKISGELEMLMQETNTIQSQLDELAKQESSLSLELNGIAFELDRCLEDVKVKQNAIAEQVQSRESWQVSLAQAQAEYEAFVQKKQVIQEQLALFTQSLDRDLQDVSRSDKDIADLASKRIVLSEDIERISQFMHTLNEQKQTVSSQLEGLLAQKQEILSKLNVLKAQIKVLEDRVIEIKNEWHQCQMKDQEIHFNQRALKDRLLQSYKIEWDVLSAPKQEQIEPLANVETLTAVEGEASPLPQEEAQGELQVSEESELAVTTQSAQPAIDVPAFDSTAIDVEALKVEIEKLKKRCESYGAVNLVAIEEFDELKNRYEFLTKQQSDLLTAREQLLSTIQKINRTTRQMFTDTFTRVNEEFQIYFRQLFGGGEAQLILLDPENALECGIDIVARPPGKKPQSISLLSGGEKSLTAIGLIFAVFKVNPSPFCVLDEIDAALDESNVGRFATMLKDFAKIAQFVVITHNKRTMQVADMMYGVTQQERGVSRIVSVKFNEVDASMMGGPAKNVQKNEESLATA